MKFLIHPITTPLYSLLNGLVFFSTFKAYQNKCEMREVQ